MNLVPCSIPMKQFYKTKLFVLVEKAVGYLFIIGFEGGTMILKIKILTIVVVLLVMIGCTIPDISNLGLPKWTTTLEMYLMSDRWAVTELAVSHDIFSAQGDTLIVTFDKIETIVLDFNTDPVVDQAIIEFGGILLNDPPPKTAYISLFEIASHLEEVDGMNAIVEPFLLKETDQKLEIFEEFEEVIVASGEGVITVENDTCIWLGNTPADKPFIIEVLSTYTDELLLEIVFQKDIAPFAIEQQITPLTGEAFPNDMYLRLKGGSLGTDGDSGDIIDFNSEFIVSLDFENITARYARAVIPEQTINDEYDIVLDEKIIIYEAYVQNEDAYLNLDITNGIDLDLIVTLVVEDLLLPEAEERKYFEYETFIYANSSISEQINLRKAHIGSGYPLYALKSYVKMKTIDSGEEVKEIFSTDSIIVDTTIDELRFSYVRGILRPSEQETIEGSVEFAIDYPDFDGVFSQHGYSELKFVTDIPIPAYLEVDIHSYGSNGEIVQLLVYRDGQLPIFNVQEGRSTIIITSEEYNINELLSIMPDRITYSIKTIAGCETEPFEHIYGNNAIIEMELLAEIDFAIDTWFIPKKDDRPETSVVSTEGFNQSIYDFFNKAELKLKYHNTTGIDFGVQFLISETDFSDFDQVYYPDSSSVSIINVPMLQVTGNDNFKELSVIIKQQNLRNFLADSVYVIPKLYLKSEAGNPLSGFIELVGTLSLEVEISNSLID